MPPVIPLPVAGEAAPRLLLFSQRHVEVHMWEAPQLEFEDVLMEVDDAVMLAPASTWTGPIAMWSSRTGNAARRLIRRPHRWPMQTSTVSGEYDLFFATFHFPKNISMMRRLKGVRERCRVMACHLIEVWSPDLRRRAHELRALRVFDHIFVTNGAIREQLEEMIDRPVHLLPTASDLLRFSPYPGPPRRCIDVYNYGRGSDAVHEQLARMAERKEIFYVHSRVNHEVPDYRAHRVQIADLLKRSRYFLAYRINENRLQLTGGDETIPTRFFEGAAAGSVILGSQPRCAEWDRYFGWDDAVIPVPWKPEDLAAILRELDDQPLRFDTIRRRNAVRSLRRNDWVHRWEEVLGVVGLPVTARMSARKAHLDAMADEAMVRSLPTDGVQAAARRPHSRALAQTRHPSI
jgi:hypothetical protein